MIRLFLFLKINTPPYLTLVNQSHTFTSMIEKLTIPAYAKRIGVSRQAVYQALKALIEGKRSMKGVVRVEEIAGSNKSTFIIHFNPQYQDES